MSKQDYTKYRAQLVTAGAAALVIAETIAAGLPNRDLAVNDGPQQRVKMAFDVAEAFIVEAEKRLGGQIPME